MILEPGEKVHIVERRYFADDVRSHLIGEVLRCTARGRSKTPRRMLFRKPRRSFASVLSPRERLQSRFVSVLSQLRPAACSLSLPVHRARQGHPGTAGLSASGAVPHGQPQDQQYHPNEQYSRTPPPRGAASRRKNWLRRDRVHIELDDEVGSCVVVVCGEPTRHQ